MEPQKEPRKRKYLWWVLATIVLLIVIGSLTSDAPVTVENTGGVEQREEVMPEPKEEVPPEPAPIVLSGTGQQASQKFTLENGLSVFRMTHDGTSNFSITLMDGEGRRIELLVNEIGRFDGSKAVGISGKGEYLLDISASGGWTVTIERPRPETAVGKPITLKGTGQQASSFVKLDKGLVVFKLKHSGDSNFAVLLMDKDGNRENLLVNEIGEFDGSKAVRINRSDIYLMDITADGQWEISIE